MRRSPYHGKIASDWFEKSREISISDPQFRTTQPYEKGNFVFHTGGWGTGEIVDVSLVREELVLEFEYVVGSQHFSFEKAFKTLFLSARSLLFSQIWQSRRSWKKRQEKPQRNDSHYTS